MYLFFFCGKQCDGVIGYHFILFKPIKKCIKVTAEDGACVLAEFFGGEAVEEVVIVLGAVTVKRIVCICGDPFGCGIVVEPKTAAAELFYVFERAKSGGECECAIRDRNELRLMEVELPLCVEFFEQGKRGAAIFAEGVLQFFFAIFAIPDVPVFTAFF